MKKIIGIISVLFVLYLIIEFTWSIINMQHCASDDLPKNATCEQIAENNAKNCKYVILKWKKVDYNEELRQCLEWEQNEQSN